ncbi:MAG: hypothetical protein ACMUIM_07695 [bacterium]
MFRKRKFLFLSLFILIIFISMAIIGVIKHSTTEAQYWALMPPYNVLWPLWSGILSPINPVTGLAAPLVTELTAATMLPIQPCLAWDPCQPLPWALYNAPPLFGGGLTFFDEVYGLHPWPPPYLLDPLTGAPAPITFLGTWSLIDATSVGHIEYLIPLANATFALTYGLRGQPFLDLLTAAQIFGLPPILPF